MVRCWREWFRHPSGMKNILGSAVLWLTLLPALASAQIYLPPGVGLPPQSVIGNTLPQAGDAVAVPFAQLKAAMNVPQVQACSSHNWFTSISSLGVFGCTQPSISDIAGFGTGVPAALVINIGAAGSVVVNGGGLGTPSSGVATNLTGTAAGLTAGSVSALGANQVTRANLAQGIARSVIGVAGNATANPADIQGTTANTYLGVNAAGTGLAFSVPTLSTATNTLGANVAMNNTANYFDGPSMAQGSTGTWCASGSVTVTDTGAAALFSAKLWDGTTVIASGQHATGGASFSGIIALSGCLASPAGNIRISVKDASFTTGFILFNQSGNSKDATITGWRVQ